MFKSFTLGNKLKLNICIFLYNLFLVGVCSSEVVFSFRAFDCRSIRSDGREFDFVCKKRSLSILFFFND